MDTYIGTKIIQAKPMSKHEFATDRGRESIGNNEAGYLVKYADGYISWSPALVFDRAYRKISPEERKLV